MAQFGFCNGNLEIRQFKTLVMFGNKPRIVLISVYLFCRYHQVFAIFNDHKLDITLDT
jgi:hypothetical protein